MIARIRGFLVVSIFLLILGVVAVFLVSLVDCGMGPDAQQACYDRQKPWVVVTVAAFLSLEAIAGYLIFRGQKG